MLCTVWRCALLHGEDGLLSIVIVCFTIGFDVCVEVCPAAWRGWSAVHRDCLLCNLVRSLCGGVPCCVERMVCCPL